MGLEAPRTTGGVRTRGGRSQGLQCSMDDTSREIGRGRGWHLPLLRRMGGGENRRDGRSQGLQCSRVLYGSGATGARPAEVYCKGAGATAEYCTGAEECVEGSTAPVRRRGLSYRGEAREIRPWGDPSVQGDDQLRLSLRQRSRQPFAEI